MNNRKQIVHRAIIFLHIEKTAGTSISNLIAKAHDPEAMLRIGSTPELMQILSKPSGKRYTAIMGHLFYGMHLFGLTYHPYAYYTMLRDPVDRLVSQYHYIRRTPGHHLHQLVNTNNLSLEQFARTNHHANQQVIRLGFHIHHHGNRFEIGHTDKDILVTAKHTLVHGVKHFGIYEHFDESIDRLSALIGVSINAIPQENVSFNRQKVADLDRSTLDLIRQGNALDMALYEFAKQVFKEGKTPLGF